MSETDDQIKAGMRRLLAEQGSMVQPNHSIYGWHDYEAMQHIKPWGYNADNKPCSWVIPEGIVVKECDIWQFVGTDCDNELETGLNAEGISCACGKYTDVTLRLDISLGEAIRHLIGYDTSREMKL